MRNLDGHPVIMSHLQIYMTLHMYIWHIIFQSSLYYGYVYDKINNNFFDYRKLKYPLPQVSIILLIVYAIYIYYQHRS